MARKHEIWENFAEQKGNSGEKKLIAGKPSKIAQERPIEDARSLTTGPDRRDMLARWQGRESSGNTRLEEALQNSPEAPQQLIERSSLLCGKDTDV